MDYELLEKLKIRELKNQKWETKKEFVARVIVASKNRIQPVKTPVEIKSDLINE